MTTDQPHSVRLNNAMVPKSYNLFVHVNLAEWSYSAEEVIVLEKNARYTGAPTTDIRLHAAATMEIDAIDGARRSWWSHTAPHVQLARASFAVDASPSPYPGIWWSSSRIHLREIMSCVCTCLHWHTCSTNKL